MNIVIVAIDFKPNIGGVAEYTHQIAYHLHLAGDNVLVLSKKMEKDKDFDSTCPYKIKRYDYDSLKFSRVRRYQAIKNIAIEHSANVIISNAFLSETSLCYIVSKFKNIPYCIFAYGMEFNKKFDLGRDLKGIFATLKERLYIILSLKGANRVFCVSNFTQKLVENHGVSHSRTLILFPGLSKSYLATAIKKLNFPLIERLKLHNKQVVLTISRLIERKGIDKAIRAMEIVRKKIPNIIYIIVGDGPYRSNLEKLAEKLNLQDNVIFTGYVREEEKSSYYNVANMFVMPNRELDNGDVEGFGIVFLEANAHGKPVIGGKSGGVVDAIVANETGLLVNPIDVEEIASAMLQLLENEDYAKQLGMNGKKRAKEEFNWEILISRMQSELRQL